MFCSRFLTDWIEDLCGKKYKFKLTFLFISQILNFPSDSKHSPKLKNKKTLYAITRQSNSEALYKNIKIQMNLISRDFFCQICKTMKAQHVISYMIMRECIKRIFMFERFNFFLSDKCCEACWMESKPFRNMMEKSNKRRSFDQNFHLDRNVWK